MSTREAVREEVMEAQVEEFVRAAQELHETGQYWLYISEVDEQMARNDEAVMRRHEIAGKVLGLLRIKLRPPMKMFGSIYPVVDHLEYQGQLESVWEPAVLAGAEHPQRRMCRLVEEPETLAA